MKYLALVPIILMCLIIANPAYSEVPLEDPSYAEGIKAIRDMHGLNLLGMTGELITVFTAVNEASKAAQILHQNKWRPGDDDLSWVDKQREDRKHDPLRGLTPDDRREWNDRWEKIKYLQGLATPYSTASEKKEISDAIQMQISHLNRIIADYGDIVEQVGFAGQQAIDVVGIWPNTIHTHEGCKTKKNFCKSYRVELAFSRDNDSNVIARWGNYSLRGKLAGTSYSFSIFNGNQLHGKGHFTFNSDLKGFQGQWNDNYGHQGTWTGKR